MIVKNRPLTSYAKVQTWIGHLIRSSRFQTLQRRVRTLRYLDLGCGRNTHSDFINLDYLWSPGVDLCWDIVQPLPLRDASLQGIFSEHCLEHFSLPTAVTILRECRRILAPGGTLRVVVPDGEAYMRTYCRHLDGDTSQSFPFAQQDQLGDLSSPILSLNRVFYQDRDSPYGHRFMYDFHVLDLPLRRAGFDSVCKQAYRRGCDPTLLIDSAARAPESLYVEATVAKTA
ncbi:MAG TPA: methyltransferase domain-containing protein [Ramlibacter sp.]|nr:methyltransferase domain-containing protein [Ramlibacter sp.]